MQLFQTPEHVVVLTEMVHDARIIRMNAEHDPPEIRKWLGDSIGHWEGDTLVVETANFSDATVHRFPSSRNTKAVERFRVVSKDRIDYQFTIEDATVYTSPWTAVRQMPRLDDYIMYEYACHEGNYGMHNLLISARSVEAAGELP